MTAVTPNAFGYPNTPASRNVIEEFGHVTWSGASRVASAWPQSTTAARAAGRGGEGCRRTPEERGDGAAGVEVGPPGLGRGKGPAPRPDPGGRAPRGGRGRAAGEGGGGPAGGRRGKKKKPRRSHEEQ